MLRRKKWLSSLLVLIREEEREGEIGRNRLRDNRSGDPRHNWTSENQKCFNPLVDRGKLSFHELLQFIKATGKEHRRLAIGQNRGIVKIAGGGLEPRLHRIFKHFPPSPPPPQIAPSEILMVRNCAVN